ncbi:MAG TPA: hypothetical protein VF099_00175 [Ktedonobacterales bacterium]
MFETQLTVAVEARVFGKRQPLFPPWQPRLTLPVDPDGQTLLHALIAAVVIDEVAEFHERQQQRRFVRVLTPEQLQQGAEAGKIDAGGQDEQPQMVDAQEAITTAQQAFEDGLYYVFVDEQRITALDQRVALHEGSHVLFLRLVALVGG